MTLEIGMAAVSDDDLPTVTELAVFQQARRAWVATDDADLPVGYVLVDVVDGCAHVEQISIHPRYARQGLGKQLLDIVERWARQSAARGLDRWSRVAAVVVLTSAAR
jgi:ribosomal protein S18 acetylase RimI-like enzyme